MKLPPRDYCEKLFYDYKVPINIRKHCFKVNQAAVFLAKKLQDENIDIELIDRLTLIHDLMKAVTLDELKEDPRFNAPKPTEEELEMWKTLKEKYKDLRELTCPDD